MPCSSRPHHEHVRLRTDAYSPYPDTNRTRVPMFAPNTTPFQQEMGTDDPLQSSASANRIPHDGVSVKPTIIHIAIRIRGGIPDRFVETKRYSRRSDTADTSAGQERGHTDRCGQTVHRSDPSAGHVPQAIGRIGVLALIHLSVSGQGSSTRRWYPELQHSLELRRRELRTRLVPDPPGDDPYPDAQN